MKQKLKTTDSSQKPGNERIKTGPLNSAGVKLAIYLRVSPKSRIFYISFSSLLNSPISSVCQFSVEKVVGGNYATAPEYVVVTISQLNPSPTEADLNILERGSEVWNKNMGRGGGS